MKLQGIWEITCSGDFNTLELDHLAKKLHPAECMKLLEAMYSRTPLSSLKDAKESSEFQNTSEYCRIKLDEWNRTFPGELKIENSVLCIFSSIIEYFCIEVVKEISFFEIFNAKVIVAAKSLFDEKLIFEVKLMKVK